MSRGKSQKTGPDKTLKGYVMSNIDGSTDRRLGLPDGRAIRLHEDEKLLVINDEPKYLVKTAEDVIRCIRKYALDAGFRTFTINDMALNNKVLGERDTLMASDHIMFLIIEKHVKTP